MTLLLCLILAAVATALATYASTGLKTTRVTDGRNNAVSALDAGLRIGLELVKQNPGSCTGAGATYTGTSAINGTSLTVMCTPINVGASTTWTTYRITAAVSASISGTAVVQASTSSGSGCAAVAQSPPCQLTINSWSISA